MKFSFSSLYRRPSDPTDVVSDETQRRSAEPTEPQDSSLAPASSIEHDGADAPVPVFRGQAQLALHANAVEETHPPSSFAIPRPAMDASRLSERWLPPGVSVNVAGTILEGGMLYVGEQLRNADIRDPSAIVPSREVAYAGDFSNAISGYYPTYGSISPSQRRAYLNWLAGGRCDPSVAIGFVFLYFYGLERRVIADGTRDVTARADFPAIDKEIRRLLALYAAKSTSFKGYATRLLSMIEAITPHEPPYNTEARPTIFEHDEQGYLTWALAHCAADEAPLPGRLALLYLKRRRRPKALADHDAAYTQLFLSAYEEAFPDGLMLTQGRREITITYKAASHGLGGAIPRVWPIVGLSACGNEQSVFEWIQDVGQQATGQIAAYAKAVRASAGSLTTGAESLYALLLLPRQVWPTSYARRFESLAAEVGSRFPVMTLGELRRMLRIDGELSRTQIATLAQVLQEHRMYMEPSLATRAKAPNDDDEFVLFLSDDPRPQHDSVYEPGYPEARLSMHLAFTVAHLGDAPDAAVARMDAVAAEWPGLAPFLRARLRAYVRLVHTEPKATARLSTRLSGIPAPARRAMAARIVALAIGSSTATPTQVKALGQIYRALGAETDQAILEIHRLGTSDAPANAGVPSHLAEPSTGFRLDTARVASLQRDTERTTALLADIFVDDEETNAPPGATSHHAPVRKEDSPSPIPQPIDTNGGLLPGLDSSHSAFARFLLTRDEWPRDELLAATAERDMLLDGALEVINDAAYDHLNIPFTEGDDPVLLNFELKERLAV